MRKGKILALVVALAWPSWGIGHPSLESVERTVSWRLDAFGEHYTRAANFRSGAAVCFIFASSAIVISHLEPDTRRAQKFAGVGLVFGLGGVGSWLISMVHEKRAARALTAR